MRSVKQPSCGGRQFAGAPATTTTYYEDEDMNKEPFYITYLRAAAIIFSIFTLMEWFIE